MRFDIGTLDSGERSLPFALLVFYLYHKVKTYLSSLLLEELFSVSKFTCSPKKESEKLKNSHFGQIHVQFVLFTVS